MKKRNVLAMISVLILCSVSWAQAYVEEEEEGLNYDALIRKLSKSNDSSEDSNRDPFEDVKIHLGVGLTNSVFSVAHPNGDKTFAAQRGVEVGLGIDLFSRNWLAEGTFRNYGDGKYKNSEIGLKEFDLKLIYHSIFAQGWGFRLGGGIAARYLSVKYVNSDTRYEDKYETPASVLVGGIETYLTSKLSLGVDGSVRNTLIDESPDKTAFDLTLRVNGHF